jgi:hypothetical protein
LIAPGGSFPALRKLLIDRLCFAPPFLVLFFLGTATFEGKSPREAWRLLRVRFWPALQTNWSGVTLPEKEKKKNNFSLARQESVDVDAVYQPAVCARAVPRALRQRGGSWLEHIHGTDRRVIRQLYLSAACITVATHHHGSIYGEWYSGTASSPHVLLLTTSRIKQCVYSLCLLSQHTTTRESLRRVVFRDAIVAPRLVDHNAADRRRSRFAPVQPRDHIRVLRGTTLVSILPATTK